MLSFTPRAPDDRRRSYVPFFGRRTKSSSSSGMGRSKGFMPQMGTCATGPTPLLHDAASEAPKAAAESMQRSLRHCGRSP